MDSPTLLRTAHLLGFTASGFLSGFSMAASYYTLPAIALSPLPVRLRQWLVVYDMGKLVSPPLAALSLLTFSFLAFQSHYSSTSSTIKSSSSSSGFPLADWKTYALAGALTFSILPWTIAAMMPTNSALIKAAHEVQSGKVGSFSEAESKRLIALIEKWGLQNWVRTVMPLVGAGVGIWAILP